MAVNELDDRIFRTVVDHAVDGVVIATPDGRILAANPAACAIFAATQDQLRGLGRAGISNPDDPAWHKLLDERRRSGRAVGVVPMYRADGSPLLAEVSTAVFDSPGGDACISVIVRDVTERVRMERRLVAYDEITEALLANLDSSLVLEMVARHACSIFDASYSSVIVPHESGAGVQVVAAHGRGSEGIVGKTVPPGGVPEAVMRSGQPILLHDITAVTRNEDLRALGLGPGMVAPIGAEDAALGALFVGAHASHHPYQDADLAEAARYAARSGVIVAADRDRKDIEIDLRRTTAQLQHALDSRVVIEQAKGFVACHRHVSTEAAFAMLRQYARSHNTDIHSVARQVLERRLFV